MMAGVWRTLGKQARLVLRLRSNTNLSHTRFISTSKNKKEITAVSVEPMQKSEEIKKLEEHFGNADPEAEKNWISWGYDEVDKDMDRFAYNVTAFLGITICIVWGSFIIAYMPDYKLQDWSVREAFLEIELRDKLGLPLVNPDMVSASKMVLPSDEELGETEIII